MKKITVLCGLITCMLFSSCNSFNSDTKVTVSPNFNQLLLQRSEAEMFAKAVVYMIDLDLEQNNSEYLFNIDDLNQDYVKCFNPDYLNTFLTNQPSHTLHSNDYLSDEEMQLIEYERNKDFHFNLTEYQLTLLEEFNRYCDEYHEVLKYNDEILTKIATAEGATLEGLKSMLLSTPVSYDKVVYGNSEYSALLWSNYVEMSPELQSFRNNYINAYPFNYEVNLPWEYSKFTTSQYDASLYGFEYQDVTKDFYVIDPNKDKLPGALKNENHLISYTVYNDCIEVIFDASAVNGNIMSALVYVNDGEITDIATYIQYK